MVYEMLVLDVIPGKKQEFHDVWLKEAWPIWEKHGIKHIGSWETMGSESNEVIRLFAYNDLTHHVQWYQFLRGDEQGKIIFRKMRSYLTHVSQKLLQPF